MKWVWLSLLIVIGLWFGPMIYSRMLWYCSALQSPIIADLPLEKGPYRLNGTYDTCINLGLHVLASTEFTKRLQKQFPAGTPVAKVEKELLSQGFMKFDNLAIVTAPDYWQQWKNHSIPPDSDAKTDKQVADQIQRAKITNTKMRKFLELHGGLLISDNYIWEVSWKLDEKNNLSNIHGCYRSFSR